MPPSTPRLSEVAKHLVYPEGIVSSGWLPVKMKMRDLGIEFDLWQEGIGQIVLGKRTDGQYAAGVGGIGMSIPRQVGKTFMLGSIVFALCLLYPNMTVLWTAQVTRTAGETFKSMQGLARRKRVAPFVEAIRRGSGTEAIEFTNGSRILFGARDGGFGRGFTEVDVIIFDEAQHLDEKALDDMLPATNQSRHPAGAIVFFTGTPPRPSDKGEVFSRLRSEALAGESDDTVWIEFGAEDSCEPEQWPAGHLDWDQVGRANPSFPLRTPKQAIQRMVKRLGKASIRRETLGLWDPGKSERSTISSQLWRDPALISIAPDVGALTYGVRFARDEVALAVCLTPDAGNPHVEVVDVRPMGDGIDWLAEWIAARADSRPLVVIDGREGTELLTSRLAELKFPRSLILEPSVVQVIDAHAEFLNAVRQGAMSHADQPGLNQAVRSAGKRRIGSAGGWGWTPLDESSVIALEAATLALGLRKKPSRKTTRGRGFVG